jgi:site-specific recombinase XerD
MLITTKDADLSGLVTAYSDTSKYPIFFYENGNFCWDLNDYIYHISGGKFNKYGFKPSATTINNKAERLNVFLEYIELRSKSFFDVDDDLLTEYSIYIASRNDTEKRVSTTERHIRDILNFFEYLQFQNKDLLLFIDSDEQGDNVDHDAFKYQVHAIRKYNFRSKKEYLSHECIEHLSDFSFEIDYIKDYEIDMWLDAIEDVTDNPYIIDRWNSLTILLEYTGSRISEIYDIEMSDIIVSYERKTSLKVPVGKKGTKGYGQFRYIKIPSAELSELYEFVIETKKTIEKFGIERHECLFIDVDTGKPLKESYFNSLYTDVIQESKYKNKLKGLGFHSFRHRYFTKKMFDLLQVNNGRKPSLKEAAEELLLDSLHANTDSLATYIHLAEDFDKPYERKEGQSRQEFRKEQTLLDKLKVMLEQVDASEISNEDVINALREFI